MSDAGIHCILLNWTQGDNDASAHEQATELLRAVRARNAKVPIFLMASRKLAGTVSVEVATLADEFIWILDDTASFIGGRVQAAIERYIEALLPPFAAALARYDREREYSWAAPGHQGGVAFLKSPIGRAFFDFYGENLFRTDMGIERGALGSLLGHTGPIGESERYAARVFGAHRSYSVLNGTSASNRAIMSACVGDDEIALCDRNCHKSIEQGLAITRRHPGVPEPDAQSLRHHRPDSARAARAGGDREDASPTIRSPRPPAQKRAVYSVLTNCTYDGMCYDAADASKRGSRRASIASISTKRGTATRASIRCTAIATRCAATRPTHPKDGPTVFATHSTHKLLAALSQTSYIHIRDGRGAIDHGRFNEAYCSQASTSPLYALIASNDVAAAMMDGPAGQALTQETIDEAVACRLAVARVAAGIPREEGLVLRAVERRGSARTRRRPSASRSTRRPRSCSRRIRTAGSCIPARAGTASKALPDGWCMLDPIKFGIVCPGMKTDGQLEKTGIPADIVTAYLGRHGIVPSRTTDHMVLFLFSMGVTKGKWGTLLNTLLDFKADYDRNAPLAEVVAGAWPRPRRSVMRARASRISATRCGRTCARAGRGTGRRRRTPRCPTPEMTPRRAFQRLMAGDAEKVPLDKMADRVVAVGVIPYPPGIPIVMPGESVGPDDGPWLTYLRTLQEYGHLFPGFAKEVEGAEEHDGVYHVYCVKERGRADARERKS